MAPDGVDGYFENVGGEIMNAVLPRMNAFGRIALCGLIAGYDGKPIPISNPSWFLISRLLLKGFIVTEHMEVWPAALKELGDACRDRPHQVPRDDRPRHRERAAGLPRHVEGRQFRQATGEARVMKELAGKVAVITGAGSGFGREFARLGAREGMKLVLADVQRDALDATRGRTARRQAPR